MDDMLSDLAADLVGARHNQPFLRELFEVERGRWVPVVELCNVLPEMRSRLVNLPGMDAHSLRVVWLDYPEPSRAQSYRLVVFFHALREWSSVAVFNMESLADRGRR